MITVTSANLHPPVLATASLRGALSQLFSRSSLGAHEILTDISLDLTPGTRLGLLGPNGAGKSSLLRLLAGIYTPTSGQIISEGKTVTLFDLQFGMDEEASGYKNLEIAGALLGISKAEVRRITPEIEAFSELGEALHRPIKSYSDGMRVRLAFSLVTHVKADNFLIDEIIGVGDAAFLEKAQARMRVSMDRAQVLVLASHANQVLEEFCTTGVIVVDGRILYHGPISEAIREYQHFLEKQA